MVDCVLIVALQLIGHVRIEQCAQGGCLEVST